MNNPADTRVAEAPWHAGLRSVRALLAPGLVLQATAVALVLAYYFWPPAAGVFARLAHWQSAGGFAFSAVSTAICGGLLPFLFLRIHPDTRATHPWPHLAFFLLFWAWKGAEVDLQYRLLAKLYGTGHDAFTVARKVLTDQFGYNLLYAGPVGNLCVAWKDAGFRWGPVVADVRAGLEVMSQRDPRDPWWVPAPLAGPKPKGPIKVALAKIPEDMKVDPSVRAALTQAADDLEKSGYRVSEVEVPDISGVWQTWCDIITNETVTLQEAAMLAVTSQDFHTAWGGMKAKAASLDLANWMKACAARSAHIRRWQMFFEDYPVVLAPTTVQPTPGPREDTVSRERVQEIFWNDIRFISAINVLGLPAAVVPVSLHRGRPIGVQLIAGRYREDLALDAAAAIEKRAGMLVRRLWEQMG